MCKEMGPHPKKNVVPAHSGPEEAFMKLYHLLSHEPELKDQDGCCRLMRRIILSWLSSGSKVGESMWGCRNGTRGEMKNPKNGSGMFKYDDPKFGEHRRPSWGDYAQDSISCITAKNYCRPCSSSHTAGNRSRDRCW